MNYHSCGTRRLSSKFMCMALAVLISFPVFTGALLSGHSKAYGDELSDASAKVEETTSAYNEAKAAYDEIANSIADREQKISDLKATIPGHQQAASAAAKNLYKADDTMDMLINILVCCDNLDELLNTMDALQTIYDKNESAIKMAVDLSAQLKAENDALAGDMEAAQAKLDEADAALEEAKAARTKIQREVYGGGGAAASGAQTSGLEPVDWNVSEDEFIATWAPRINDYMAGSPMAGYGETFAQMSYRYGSDPRWSPAISMIESGRGSVCFASHNAWGMIAAGGFPSWEAGIEANCKLLASSLYGGVLTMRAAQTYCNSDWYYKVLAQMQRI